MAMRMGLQHPGGVPNPRLGVQGHFLEVVTPTGGDDWWVTFRAQGDECIAGHGAAGADQGGKRAFGGFIEPELNVAGPRRRAGSDDVMVLAVAFAFYRDGSWESEVLKAVGCPDWGEFLKIIQQWCRKWSDRRRDWEQGGRVGNGCRHPGES